MFWSQVLVQCHASLIKVGFFSDCRVLNVFSMFWGRVLVHCHASQMFSHSLSFYEAQFIVLNFYGLWFWCYI